jgi:glycosyltransferase involved in cell wall biosynthesis
MKLLHVVASYLPARRYGGTIVSVHGLCRALAARGHQVHVYTTSVDGDQDSPVVHGVPVDIDGVAVTYFRSESFRRLYYAPPLRRAIHDHVREFDVVHTHAIYLWPLWAAAREAHAAGVPHVLSPRGMLEKELIERKSALWKAALIGFVEKRHFESAAAVHVTSAREADEARAFGFDVRRFVEIPNGVDFESGAGGAPSAAIREVIEAGPFILFLGRINWKKGLDRLIAALPGAPSVRLVLAGNDEENYRPTLEAAADRAGVRNRVLFVGAVAGANKSSLLQAASGLVLPSYSENFGNVVLEAMAAGKPVIVTPEVGIAGLVRDSGAGLVVDGSPDRLAAALSTLVTDRNHGAAMGERGRATAQRFGWDAIAIQMERLYESIRVAPC